MPENQGNTAEALLAALASFSTMVEFAMSAQQHSLANMDEFRNEMKCLREKIAKLNKVLHEGNGKEPVMLRLAWLEDKVKDILAEKATAEERLRADAQTARDLVLADAKAAKELELEDHKGKWALWHKIVAGILGVPAVVIPLLAQC